MTRRTVLAGVTLGTLTLALPAAAQARIDDLIARMTIAEKAGQLSCFNDDVRPVGAVFNPVVDPRSAEQMLAEVSAGRVGMLFNGYGVGGARRAQAAALRSRLGIPLLFAADVIHGCRTIFPIPLAEAAAFDPALSERAARAVAQEARAGGLHWTLAPMVDVARDQRWGRVAEGAGEDVQLGRLLAAARVRGFMAGGLIATPKHFAGYGAVRGGMEYADVEVSEASLREVHLPPFAAAFSAGAQATMASFTAVNGVPASANHWLLTDVLRRELGFAGVSVSDYDADRELVAHGVATDEADAARLAILAGVDMSMQSGLYNRHLPALVASGRVPVARVDEAVRRVLTLKDAAGLFDDPFQGLNLAAERRRTATPAIKASARELATRSIVLLRNRGDLLPLPRAGKRIALVGPFGADRDNLNGPWSFAGQAADGIDFASGVQAMLRDPAMLSVEQGSGVHEALPGGIARASAAAKAADVVLLAIGEAGDMSGEGNSRTAIVVPPAQQALTEAVAATGTPIVVLLKHGRALALEGAVRDAPAILATWFLGEQTGAAVADVLFGVREPTGRLPVSFPYASGQQPWSYDHPSTGRPASDDAPMTPGRSHWRDAPDRALFPFGSGQGYTRFALSGLTVSEQVAAGGQVAISVQVANTGRRRGQALLAAYVHDIVASRVRPVRQLKAFTRVALNAGEQRRVALSIPHADLALVDAAGAWRVEPGAFNLWVDAGEGTEQHARFEAL